MSQGRWFFVVNNPPYRTFRAPKRYEVQLLDAHGQAAARGYFDSAEEELILDGVRVDRRVLLAAMAQVGGQGTYVDETGNPTQPFSSHEEWSKRVDVDALPATYRIDDIVRGLRDTLTDEMGRKAYRIRYKRLPTPAELTAFKNQLVNEHYDEGFDTWVEKHLYFDPHA